MRWNVIIIVNNNLIHVEKDRYNNINSSFGGSLAIYLYSTQRQNS